MLSLDQLEEKVAAMNKLCSVYEEDNSGIRLDDAMDPLVDFEQDTLIGETLRGCGMCKEGWDGLKRVLRFLKIEQKQ